MVKFNRVGCYLIRFGAWHIQAHHNGLCGTTLEVMFPPWGKNMQKLQAPGWLSAIQYKSKLKKGILNKLDHAKKVFNLNIKICRIFLLGNVRKHGTTSRRSTTCPVCDGAWQIARGRSDLVPYGLDVISKRADKHITSTLGRRGGAKISFCFASTHVDIILLLPLERLYLCFPVSNNSSLRC